MVQDHLISFDEAWALYPKKIGKSTAKVCFARTVKNAEDFKNIFIALRNYLQSERVKSGYIQDGKRWFKEWEDWLYIPDPVAIRQEREASNKAKWLAQGLCKFDGGKCFVDQNNTKRCNYCFREQ